MPQRVSILFWSLAVFVEQINSQTDVIPTFTRRTTPRGLWARATTRLYDPNYGFKQYWPGGDWMLAKHPVTKPRSTSRGETTTLSTTAETICGGEECPHAYRHIKTVCVVDSYDYTPRPMFTGFKTVPTYCQFLKLTDPNCRPEKYHALVFVHLGPCGTVLNQNKAYKLKYTADTHLADVSPRIWHFLKRFKDQKEWTKFYKGTIPNASLFRNRETVF